MPEVHLNDLTDPNMHAGLRPNSQLDFLWLELTNRCNLQCVHCYTESGPSTGMHDLMTAADYEQVMRQAFELGCRKLQFIGGEPQLNSSFHHLLVQAKSIGFSFIEVFTNLTRLKQETLEFAADNDIRFATSVYSSDAHIHDAITKSRASHDRTISNLTRLIAEGVKTRAAIIVMDENRNGVEHTVDYLSELGVPHVRHSTVQAFGRGQEKLLCDAGMSGLCGHCWNGKLCVAPDGNSYPCVMARHWPVGNVLHQSLEQIMGSLALRSTRQKIFDDVWLPRLAASKTPGEGRNRGTQKKKAPSKRKPLKSCAPASDGTNKDTYRNDKGKGGTKPKPANECPQSCVPDLSTCGPASCPQSCQPFIVVCEPTGEE